MIDYLLATIRGVVPLACGLLMHYYKAPEWGVCLGVLIGAVLVQDRK